MARPILGIALLVFILVGCSTSDFSDAPPSRNDTDVEKEEFKSQKLDSERGRVSDGADGGEEDAGRKGKKGSDEDEDDGGGGGDGVGNSGGGSSGGSGSANDSGSKDGLDIEDGNEKGDGISGNGGNGNLARPEVTIQAAGANGNFTKDKIEINFRDSARISWTGKDVVNCVITRERAGEAKEDTGWSGNNGEELATDQQKTAIFQADCQDASGNPVVDEVEVVILGGWYQANQQVCSTFCTNLGKQNVPDKDGAMCSSGESISPTAVGILNYPWGCWPNGSCPATGRYQGNSSVGTNCYGPGQKRDNDSTDRTTGCYCK